MKSTFQGCLRLAEVKMPSSLTHIGHKAFTECIEMAAVNLPASLTHLGKEAFSSCATLSDVHLPIGLSYLGTSAFQHCHHTLKVHLPLSILVAALARSRINPPPIFYLPNGRVSHADGLVRNMSALVSSPCLRRAKRAR
jgi:hypothetical protein